MTKTSEAFEAQKNNRISNLVKAMQGWNESLGTVSMSSPGGKYGRSIIIKSGQVTIDGTQLDVEFDIPFNDESEAEESEIIIYNLSDNTASLLKHNQTLTITVGYKGDTGIIFSGRIIKCETKWSGLDKITKIRVLDSYNLQEREVVSIAFAKGVKASYVLKTLVGYLGLPIAVFSVKRDHTYASGVTVDGGLMEAIKQYAGVCGVSVYINLGKVYVRHTSQGDNIGFAVDVDNGLLDSPEEFTEERTNEESLDTVHGVKMKMLLEHRMTTGVFVNLKSKNFKGVYRVREGRHVCNETDFYTEITCIDVGTSAAPSTNVNKATGSRNSTSTKKWGADITPSAIRKNH